MGGGFPLIVKPWLIVRMNYPINYSTHFAIIVLNYTIVILTVNQLKLMNYLFIYLVIGRWVWIHQSQLQTTFDLYPPSQMECWFIAILSLSLWLTSYFCFVSFFHLNHQRFQDSKTQKIDTFIIITVTFFFSFLELFDWFPCFCWFSLFICWFSIYYIYIFFFRMIFFTGLCDAM